jgi:ABC-type branched-subunit amino acid transport system substrate-binding protein
MLQRPHGQSTHNGAAAQEINASGGLLGGRKIEIVASDPSCLGQGIQRARRNHAGEALRKSPICALLK